MAPPLTSPLHFSLGSVTLFTTLRNPNLSPPTCSTKLSFSPSLPVRPPPSHIAMTSSSIITESRRLPFTVSSDDFIGIEDISDTQWAADPKEEDLEGEEGEGDREAIELWREAEKIQAVQQRTIERKRNEDPRKSKLAELKLRRANRLVMSGPLDDPIDLSSSPPKPSFRANTVDSRTPETTREPITPHASGSTRISWSSSSANDEKGQLVQVSTKKRKAHAVALFESDSQSEDEMPLAIDKGKGRATSPYESIRGGDEPDYDPGVEAYEEDAGDGAVEEDYDKAFDDFCDIDIDFDCLPTTTGLGPKSPVQFQAIDSHTIARPTPPRSRYPLVPISTNQDSALTAALDRPGLPMLHQLSEKEQDFYKNHWRRGADRAAEKRAEDRWAPEKAAAAKKAMRVVKRGVFRGRGRGRGRGKGRKR